LIVCQAFPPLFKNAGGVAKRYLTLCKALIDDLGYEVTLVTPVNVLRAQVVDIERWIRQGRLRFTPARGVKVDTKDGTGMYLDLFSFANAFWFWNLLQHPVKYDVAIMDDVPWRFNLLLQLRAMQIPTIITSHTDAVHLEQSSSMCFKFAWWAHMKSACLADVHASVSKVFGNILRERENCHINAVWPPILWSSIFRESIETYAAEAQEWRRSRIFQLGYQPKALLLSAGRWAKEKRIHLMFDAVPDDCALVVVGDGTSAYAEQLEAMASNRRNVLVVRGMLDDRQLRVAYQGSDLFVSASNFETLGNTIVEAIASGTPVAVQPAQGHLEHVIDGENSYFVDFNDTSAALAKLELIVATGLPSNAHSKGCLPAFESTSERLRNNNFAREFDQNVLHIARTAAYKREEAFYPLECFIRILALLAYFITFIIMRTATRVLCVLSKFPKFEIMGELGSCVESADTPVLVEMTQSKASKLSSPEWNSIAG
jgi:glycosyltransferase involved in cell wall biosynthesis